MSLLSSLRSLARHIILRQELDDDLDEEIRSQLELMTDEKIKAGLSPDEARRAAKIELGGVEQLKEHVREVRAGAWLDSLVRDIRFALRMLRKNPLFTAVAVLTLALGIGANTAIFSVVDGILLRSLPYAQSTQLYAIHEFVPQLSAYGPTLPVNGGNFLDWQEESHAFSGMSLIDAEGSSLLGLGQPQWLYGAAVTPDFFSVVGVQPLMGRAFSAEDEVAGGKPEVILTSQAWREQFHSDPNILGRIVELGDRGLTIIGVLPANFTFPQILTHNPAYLVPFPWAQWNSKPGIGAHNYFVIARLDKGSSPKEAEAQLNAIEDRIARNNAGGQFNLYAVLTPLKTQIVGPTRQALWMLSLAAGLLLLIVCANLANLLLTNNSKRVREIALRSTFGAGRWRLVRQFITETLLLASAGGVFGLVVAKFGLWLLLKNAPAGIPRVDQVRLDSMALWFTFVATILAALLFGLAPSLRATRSQLAEQLKSSGPTTTAAKEGVRLRNGLVIAEIALCATLLPVCLLLIGSLRHVVAANQWMNEDRVIAADLVVPFTNASESDILRDRERILTSIEEKVGQLPGVESAGFTNTLPLEGLGWGDAVNVQEVPLPDNAQPSGEFRFVSPGYFGTVALPLVKGRFFTAADREQPVAVISQSVAEKVLVGRDPLGMHVECGFGGGQQRWCRVVGEVADVRDDSDQPTVLAVYFPLWIHSGNSESLVVRTKMDPGSTTGAIRKAVWGVDPNLAIPREKTLSTILAAAEAPRRYETSLVAFFALCAVFLAMLGLYAVISYSVAQRRHEMGVRIALGAQQGDVLRMIVGEAMALAGTGIAIGISSALALAQLLRSFLFEIQPWNPPTFAGVAVLLITVALAACYIPARRATRVDPVTAMRCE